MSSKVSGLTEYHAHGRAHSNRIFGAMNWLGHILTAPMSYSCEQAVRAVHISLKPGFYGQHPDECHERGRRVGHVFLCIISGSLGIPGTIVGAPLRFLASLSRKDFRFITPSRPEVSDLESPIYMTTLKIMTFNVALGPECMSAENLTRPVRHRVHEVADAVIKKKPDIVCLQEAFHTEAEDVLIEKLKEKGYEYFICSVGHHSFKVNSGLIIASKHPLKNPIFWDNPNRGGSDRLSRKGVVATTLQVGDKSFALFNLHLNGGGPRGGEWYRTPQMTALKEHIKDYTSKEGLDRRDIICGDFNISRLEEDGSINTEWEPNREFFEVDHTDGCGDQDQKVKVETDGSEGDTKEGAFRVKGTAFKFSFHNSDPWTDGEKTTGWDKSKVDEWRLPQNQIDHILFGRNVPIQSASKTIDHMDGSSDHLAVITTVTLT